MGRQEIDRRAEGEMDRRRIRDAVKENEAVTCEDEYGLQSTVTEYSYRVQVQRRRM